MNKLLAAIGMCLVLNGCATSSNYTVGRDFSSASVATIVKGKTTTAQLRSMFGEPYMKTAVSDTDEKWIYAYTNASAHAKSYVVNMQVTTTGTQKMLDLLIRNDVVANYTYSEGPVAGSSMATH